MRRPGFGLGAAALLAVAPPAVANADPIGSIDPAQGLRFAATAPATIPAHAQGLLTRTDTAANASAWWSIESMGTGSPEVRTRRRAGLPAPASLVLLALGALIATYRR